MQTKAYKYRVPGCFSYRFFRTNSKAAAIAEAQRRANETGELWRVVVGQHERLIVTPLTEKAEVTA